MESGFIMSYLPFCVSLLLLFSSIFITSRVGAQETPSGQGQHTAEQLQFEIDELRREIRELKSKATTTAAPAEQSIASGALPGELKYKYRATNASYFSRPGGVTSPAVILVRLAPLVPGWTPDLRRSEQRTTAAILVKFK